MDSAARWPIILIMGTIPAQEKPAATEQVKRAICFYQRLLAQLPPDPNSDQTPSQSDMETLEQLYKQARKKSKSAFGYINHSDIAETLWHSLDLDQRSLVLDGEIGRNDQGRR
jgi:hypothetical protein